MPQIHWNTRIASLIRRAGRVTGVEGRNEPTGAAFRLAGTAIVSATGGYQSNLELVKANWPKDLPFPDRRPETSWEKQAARRIVAAGRPQDLAVSGNPHRDQWL